MDPFRLIVLACALLLRPVEGLAQTRSNDDLSLVQRRSTPFIDGLRTPRQLEFIRTSPVPISGEMIDTFSNSTVITNNLGGMGPITTDPHDITIKNAFTVGNVPITVVLSNRSDYIPDNPERNGRGLNGGSAFGHINMKCNTSTEIRFSFFIWANGTMVPVSLESAYVFFIDVDSGNKGLVREYMGVLEPYVADYLTSPTELESYNVSGWAGPAWISTRPGGGGNNPSDPNGLTPDQMSRAVMVEFSNVSFVDTLFGVTAKPTCSGRNIMFAFMSNMDSTAAPTSSPTPSPTPARTPAPTPSPTPSPTSIEGDVTCGTCVIWGDPHIITFKAYQRRLVQHPKREEFFRTRGWQSDQINVNEAGRQWLVKSDRVKIQGRYTKNETSGRTFLASLVVGGPFLEDHVLDIRPLNGKVTWNGVEILPSFPSVFENGLVHATYHNAAKMVKDGTAGPGIDVALPLGVTLTVNRWQGMLAAEISMCQTEEQSGQCGSYADKFY